MDLDPNFLEFIELLDAHDARFRVRSRVWEDRFHPWAVGGPEDFVGKAPRDWQP
jgi:hypothetical protein